MSKVVVLGRGYLGKEFERHGFEVLGRDKFEVPENYDVIPWLYHWERLKQYDVVVNCIGKSNTRWCEENLQDAIKVNGSFPNILSNFCAENNIKLVHISTGCLYDQPNFEKETNFIVAHCNYTVSKWIGEDGCNPKRDLILRPRLYFSDIPDRNNLLCKLQGFSRYVSELDSMTCTSTIVGATKELIQNDQVGIFNVAQDGAASMHEIAGWLGLEREPMTAEQLRKQEGLYLVNNIMDISKLQQYYKPAKIKDSIILSYAELLKNQDVKDNI